MPAQRVPQFAAFPTTSPLSTVSEGLGSFISGLQGQRRQTQEDLLKAALAKAATDKAAAETTHLQGEESRANTAAPGALLETGARTRLINAQADNVGEPKPKNLTPEPKNLTPEQQLQRQDLASRATYYRSKFPDLAHETSDAVAVHEGQFREELAARNAGAVRIFGAEQGLKADTAPERTAGAMAQGAGDSINRLRAIAQRNPGAMAKMVAVIHTEDVLGHTAGHGLAVLRGAFDDPDVNAAYNEYNNFLLNATPAYGGVRPTAALLGLERAGTLPGVAPNPHDWDLPFTHMEERLHVLHAKANEPQPAPVMPSTPQRQPAPARAKNPLLDDGPSPEDEE